MTRFAFLRDLAFAILSERTVRLIAFDLLRLRTRIKRWRVKHVMPAQPRLHFGCGEKRVPGWLNVDVSHSDYDIDLAGGRLPWNDHVFDVAVGLHVVEHLELSSELLPLLRELRRVLKANGELWICCPDIEKICRAYVEQRLPELIANREQRMQTYHSFDWNLDTETGLKNTPASFIVNALFYRQFEHRNLFDLDLLKWTLEQAGFAKIERVTEKDLLARFPEFPARKDDDHALYVRAVPGE